MTKKTRKKSKVKKTARGKASVPARRVLSRGEPKPFRIENQKGEGIGLVICDHASNRIPKSLKGMGLKKEDLQKHIAVDIGAEDVSRHLARALKMPLMLATYSRLVMDLNRTPRHRESVPEVSDNIAIPANEKITKEARARRLKEIFEPYQAQVAKQVERFTKKGHAPVLIAVHSFTPEMGGIRRPWHIAVLWNRQERMAKKIIGDLRRAHPDLLIGENEPYSLKDERFQGSTISAHAEGNDLPYVFVEFRQDLIDTKEKAQHWAGLFLGALKPLLENLDMYRERAGKR